MLPIIGNSEIRGLSGHSEGATGGLPIHGLGVQNQHGRNLLRMPMDMARGMALSVNTGIGGQSTAGVRGHIGTSISINGSQARDENADQFDNLRSLSSRASARRDGGGGNLHERGCQHTNIGGQIEEVMNIKEIVNTQIEDIRTLFNMFEDYKTLTQAIFTVMSKEQLEEIKKLYEPRMNAPLQEMITYSESVLKVNELVKSEKESESRGKNKKDVIKIEPSASVPFKTNKLRPQSISPAGGRICLSDVTPDAAMDDRSEQQKLIDERRKQQDEVLREREAERRKYNVIIDGIEETIFGVSGDRARIENMLREMGLGHRIYDLDRIERIGRNPYRRRSRLIIATFSSSAAAYDIVYKGKRLARTYDFYNVFVRKDLNREEREEERINRRRRQNGVSDRSRAGRDTDQDDREEREEERINRRRRQNGVSDRSRVGRDTDQDEEEPGTDDETESAGAADDASDSGETVDSDTTENSGSTEQENESEDDNGNESDEDNDFEGFDTDNISDSANVDEEESDNVNGNERESGNGSENEGEISGIDTVSDDNSRNAATVEELDEQSNRASADRGNDQGGDASTSAAGGVSGNEERRKELMTE